MHTPVCRSHNPLRSRRRRIALWVALAVLYAYVAGGFRPFTAAANVSTALGGLVVMIAAARAPRPASPVVMTRTVGLLWSAWLAIATGWELWALSGLPRSDYPTISSLMDMLIDTHPARSLAVFGWLGLGWWLARQ